MNPQKKRELEFLDRIADRIYHEAHAKGKVPWLIAFLKGNCRNEEIRGLLVEFIEEERKTFASSYDSPFKTTLQDQNINRVFDKAKHLFKKNYPALWAKTEALE